MLKVWKCFIWRRIRNCSTFSQCPMIKSVKKLRANEIC